MKWYSSMNFITFLGVVWPSYRIKSYKYLFNDINVYFEYHFFYYRTSNYQPVLWCYTAESGWLLTLILFCWAQQTLAQVGKTTWPSSGHRDANRSQEDHFSLQLPQICQSSPGSFLTPICWPELRGLKRGHWMQHTDSMEWQHRVMPNSSWPTLDYSTTWL